MAAQARGVLSSTPSGCQPFHFPLFLPRNICSGVIPYCLAVFLSILSVVPSLHALVFIQKTFL